MRFVDCTWEKFKNTVTEQIHKRDNRFIYRGQSNSSWPLKTSIHRTGQWKTPEDIKYYVERIVPKAHELVAAWEGRRRNLGDPFELAQFIAYLQHFGFPTPFLDWTYSPFIAAYFAFEGVNHFEPQCSHVCIYSFDAELWQKTFRQSYDYQDQNVHVSIMEPSYVGNPKQLFQQGVFMYTNLEDIESHIDCNQKEQGPFLQKYRLLCGERSKAMRELRLMNVTAVQLAPSLESVCKKLAIDISLEFPVGKSRSEISMEAFERILRSGFPDSTQPARDSKTSFPGPFSDQISIRKPPTS